MEEAAHLDSESKKNTFEVRGPALSTQLNVAFLNPASQILNHFLVCCEL